MDKTSFSAPSVAMRLFPLSEPATIAESLVARTLTTCARQMGLQGEEAVVDRLRRGDAVAHQACQQELAFNVAEYLSSLDHDIQAIYRYESARGGLEPAEAELRPAIHLVVLTGRRTAALISVLAALDRALRQALADYCCWQDAAHVLNVSVIDASDSQTGAGYAALLFPTQRNPVEVWRR